MNDDNALYLGKLGPIQKKIAESETDSIAERWEFGHVLVALRVGKQLPKGLRAKVTDQFRLEASEITRRMQLAQRYATRDEVVDACTIYGGSWRQIIRQELASGERKVVVDESWGTRAQARVDRLVAEANSSDERRAELAAMLARALELLRHAT